MAARCKGFNSKCFLITYLIIVGFIIVLWMNRLPLMQKDTRVIPESLQSYLESPPRPLPKLVLETENKLALTTQWFGGKWNVVYFTHSNCLPDCQPSLAEMKNLQITFANTDFQFLAIGLDAQHETAGNLSQFLISQGYDFTVAVGSEKEIDKLSKIFIALFLQTDYTDGSYQIEQEHHLFVVDPKGRIYATFRPPFSSVSSQFFALRRFYAKTE
ncbi:MAG: photosynthetic protein synthase I [Methylophaga sp.]|nr:MAG: photosynthetic protein synthase I [Methylophaga sp.]